jgi:effector-binding domain-containing protein
VRRFYALMRGAGPTELYRSIEHAGVQELEGREHVLLRMTPAEGQADTWYVDAATATLSRVDTMLPAPESFDATWGVGDWVATQITFADWKSVDGVHYPHRRAMKMGPTTVQSTCTRIATSAAIEPASFTPPDAVKKIKDKPAAKLVDADGQPSYRVVEREAQAVASIRTKCKPSEVSATLAVLLPEVIAHVNATGGGMAGMPFSRYHGFGADEIDLEAGIPVSKPIPEKGRVKNSALPGGTTVTAWHFGPYEKLSAAHQALQAHAAANELKARGGSWEVYWTDPGMVPDPAKWRTQLFLPIEK